MREPIRAARRTRRSFRMIAAGASVLVSCSMSRSRVREVSLSVLLALQLYFLFFLQPAASLGIDFELPLTGIFFGVVIVVVMSASPTRSAAIAIALALLLAGLGIVLRRRLTTPVTDCLAALAALGALLAVSLIVDRTVYSPGAITVHRLGGALVVYFNFALAFGVVYRLIEALAPGSFRGVDPGETPDELAADLLYFSVVTLSTTGFGDVVPLHRIARSMAALEAVTGQLYIATVIARLVTLKRPDWPRGQGGQDADV